MGRKRNILIVMLSLTTLPLCANAEDWSCPTAEEGRGLFLKGIMAEWPNYAEADGARVQRQHPQTAFIAAQAKHIDWNGRDAAICQYYNHIGLVASSVVIGAKRHPETSICKTETCVSKAYWRNEFTYSSPDLDKAGQEQMLVCMENRDGLSFPSAACRFQTKD
jgi:hypothetical protein